MKKYLIVLCIIALIATLLSGCSYGNWFRWLDQGKAAPSDRFIFPERFYLGG